MEIIEFMLRVETSEDGESSASCLFCSFFWLLSEADATVGDGPDLHATGTPHEKPDESSTTFETLTGRTTTDGRLDGRTERGRATTTTGRTRQDGWTEDDDWTDDGTGRTETQRMTKGTGRTRRDERLIYIYIYIYI